MEKDELDTGYIIGDNMLFPKATVDPKLLKLQKDVTDFVTSVILKHEQDFYNLVQTKFKDDMSYIIGSTCSAIIEMITLTTNTFYNRIYYDIQHKKGTPLTEIILEMCQYTDYGPHILLDKLARLTFDIHLDVVREKLILKDNDIDLYKKSVLTQINIYLLSANLLHILSKGPEDDVPFVEMAEGISAINIVIDKNVSR